MTTPDELIQLMRVSSTKRVREKLEYAYSHFHNAQDWAIYSGVVRFFEGTARKSKEDGWPSPIQSGQPKEIVLPEWEECADAVNFGRASALQKFIYENEFSCQENEDFRCMLLEALKEVAQ